MKKPLSEDAAVFLEVLHVFCDAQKTGMVSIWFLSWLFQTTEQPNLIQVIGKHCSCSRSYSEHWLMEKWLDFINVELIGWWNWMVSKWQVVIKQNKIQIVFFKITTIRPWLCIWVNNIVFILNKSCIFPVKKKKEITGWYYTGTMSQ